jgi:hypothetical protein
MKEIKCERCGEIMDPIWSDEDGIPRDICSDCQQGVDDEEREKDLVEHN